MGEDIIKNAAGIAYLGSALAKIHNYTHLIVLNILAFSGIRHCESRLPMYDHPYVQTQTSAVLETFMLAMLHYPEVQVRAREEIDSVTDGTRLPEFNDRPSMPYIEAMISEVFRWAPAAPLGN